MNDESVINTLMSIDDNQLDQMLYQRIIKRSGLVANVVSFQLAEEAIVYLKSADSEPVDIILLDINMPRMNGFEFLEHATAELGSAFSRAVVVMLTTSLNPGDRQRAREYDVVKAYLNKPLTKNHLESFAGILKQAA